MTAPESLANANNASTDTIVSIVAVVTSEDGSVIKTYADAASLTDAEKAAVAAAITAAEKELEKAFLEAISKEAEEEGVELPADVLKDSTSFEYSSYGSFTVQSLLNNWNDNVIGKQNTVADVNTKKEAAIAETPAAAEAYVNALEGAAETEAIGKLTEISKKLNGINLETKEITSAAPSVVQAAIEATIEVAINDSNASFTVKNWDVVTTALSSSLTGAGSITVTGLEVSLAYEGTDDTASQTLGNIVIPYNVVRPIG